MLTLHVLYRIAYTCILKADYVERVNIHCRTNMVIMKDGCVCAYCTEECNSCLSMCFSSSKFLLHLVVTDNVMNSLSIMVLTF